MRRGAVLLVRLALSCLSGATAIGLLAPLDSLLDVPNDFRPHLLLALLACCIAAAVLKRPRLIAVAAAFAAINAALAIPPLFFVAAPAAPGTGRDIKVITSNVWGYNRNYAPLATFLREERADIVILEEADAEIGFTLADLRDLYPYRADCIDSHYCRLVILSRHPLLESRVTYRSTNIPPHIVARVDFQGSPITIVGAHLSRPHSWRWQSAEIDYLANRLPELAGPLIMAGDFNATPWSWALTSLQRRAGLQRHLTLGASWPANLLFPPQILIDHIMSRDGPMRREAHLGPNIKSDHLPLVVTLVLPST